MSQQSQQNRPPKTKPRQTDTESVCPFPRKSKDVLSLAKEVTELLGEIVADRSIEENVRPKRSRKREMGEDKDMSIPK